VSVPAKVRKKHLETPLEQKLEDLLLKQLAQYDLLKIVSKTECRFILIYITFIHLDSFLKLQIFIPCFEYE
jgi:hypothetical protein